MLSVAAAFIYKERDVKISSRMNQFAAEQNKSLNDVHCW